MKKELLVVGCSFSANYGQPFKLWTDHVAKSLNLKLVNLSFSGIGNDRIFANALDYVTKNHKRIGKVIIQWTGILRQDLELDIRDENGNTVDDPWYQTGSKPYGDPHLNSPEPDTWYQSGGPPIGMWDLWDLQKGHFVDSDGEWVDSNGNPRPKDLSGMAHQGPRDDHPDGLGKFDNIMIALDSFGYPNLESAMNGFVRKVYSLQSVFKQLNIDYYFVTGINERNFTRTVSYNGTEKVVDYEGVWDWDYICAKKLASSHYIDLIDKKRYIGWPVWELINGFCFQDIIHSGEENDWKYWISPQDGHPNELGHEKIAEVVLNAI